MCSGGGKADAKENWRARSQLAVRAQPSCSCSPLAARVLRSIVELVPSCSIYFASTDPEHFLKF